LDHIEVDRCFNRFVTVPDAGASPVVQSNEIRSFKKKQGSTATGKVRASCLIDQGFNDDGIGPL
jgi:hypothetical protein